VDLVVRQPLVHERARRRNALRQGSVQGVHAGDVCRQAVLPRDDGARQTALVSDVVMRQAHAVEADSGHVMAVRGRDGPHTKPPAERLRLLVRVGQDVVRIDLDGVGGVRLQGRRQIRPIAERVGQHHRSARGVHALHQQVGGHPLVEGVGIRQAVDQVMVPAVDGHLHAAEEVQHGELGLQHAKGLERPDDVVLRQHEAVEALLEGTLQHLLRRGLATLGVATGVHMQINAHAAPLAGRPGQGNASRPRATPPRWQPATSRVRR